jgi:hypothetical protein
MKQPKKPLKKPATQKQKLEYTMKHGSTLDKIGTGFKMGLGVPLKKGGSVKKKSKK